MRLGALLMASAAKSLVVLPRAEWAARAAAHRTRVADLLGGRPGDVAKTCAADPFLNFVFTYYKGDLGKPARLERLTAPAHVALEAGGDAEDGKLLWRRPDAAGGVRRFDPLGVSAPRLAALERGRGVLAATATKPPVWSCYGLHEWAMVYDGGGEPPPRHQALPLRLPQHRVDAVVESNELRCTHFDAFRFYADGAKPRNRWQLSRDSQAAHEQPACLHAGMDLLRYALRLAPFLEPELLGDALAVAVDARKLDMRASPYDLRGAVATGDAAPVRVETAAGRRAYVAEQARLAEAAAPVRSALLDAYDAFFLERALRSGG